MNRKGIKRRLTMRSVVRSSVDAAVVAVVKESLPLPDARNKPLRPCRVRRVFSAEALNHHLFLGAEAKREEDRERDEVGGTGDPVRNDERLTDGIEGERQVHRVADALIDTSRDQTMILFDFQRNRP